MTDAGKVFWLCEAAFVVGGALGLYLGYTLGKLAGLRLASRVLREEFQSKRAAL